jgi:phage shock protein PspC (stress-responsive transcriptional regulator)
MKLVRSVEHKMISGVCGGLGETFGIDAAIIRILFVVCTFFGVGMPIILYIILSVALPKESYWEV